MLKVEVVLFCSNTKKLTLSVSQLLLDAGVIQIAIQHTKKISQSFVVSLDTLGFPLQGPEGHSDGVGMQSSSSSSTNYAAIAGIVLGCVAGLCVLCAGLATAYKRHQRRQAAAAALTTTSSLPPQALYTALSPIGCTCYHMVQAPMPDDPGHDLA